MKKFSALVFGLLLGPCLANAADMPELAVGGKVWSWTGLYIGGHIGGGLGTTQFSDPAGASIYGDNVRSPIALGGVQAGYNWQLPHTNFVLGIEADISALNADGTNTCLASSGFFISANCGVRPSASGSLTGRVGLVTGPRGRTLVYAKAGIAALQERYDITTSNILPPISTGFDGMRWGWTVGAGLEKALTPAWSIKAEYDYANFGSVNVATPASFLQVLPPLNAYLPTPGGTSSASQIIQAFKLGLNLKLGEDLWARWEPPAAEYRLRGTSDTAYAPDAVLETGGRVWYSTGRFQKDLGSTTNQAQQDVLISRLTYDSSAATAELYGRLDTASNIFLKGFIGGGKLLSGKMHDEDWVIFDATVPYSNTVSNPVNGDLGYATFDVGYALFHGPSSKVGGFIGYNYFHENKSAFGCTQIANSNSDCVPAIANSVLGITENDRWDSLRVGVNGVVALTDRLSLTADAAYLPLVAFRGFDNHLLRNDVANTLSPESGTGQGVQLEAIIGYSLGKYFSVGAGGRYWAMWATNASTNIFGTPCPCQTLPARTERFGVFVQASARLDGLK
ncbi:MAG: outer membrane beta-barrel protein [Bradyrhizobium sp.]